MMKKLIDRISQSMGTTPEHILEAHKMADEIFSKAPALHKEMFDAIAHRLAAQYEVGRGQFIEYKKPLDH